MFGSSERFRNIVSNSLCWKTPHFVQGPCKRRDILIFWCKVTKNNEVPVFDTEFEGISRFEDVETEAYDEMVFEQK